VIGNVRETDWAQKYRPFTLDECILPAKVHNILNQMNAKRVVENTILYGSYGIGKTASAKALCRGVDCDLLEVNGSFDNRIKDLRETVESFACTCALKRGKKVVLIDEAERLSREYQDGLRGFMELVSANCTFVLTTNDVNGISGAIRSRCISIDFTFSREEAQTARIAFTARLHRILATEGATLDKRRIAEIVGERFPEFRQILKQVQMECGG
jgi:replication-associated recombination protein RarA